MISVEYIRSRINKWFDGRGTNELRQNERMGWKLRSERSDLESNNFQLMSWSPAENEKKKWISQQRVYIIKLEYKRKTEKTVWDWEGRRSDSNPLWPRIWNRGGRVDRRMQQLNGMMKGGEYIACKISLWIVLHDGVPLQICQMLVRSLF